jgi:hypothetical protein
MDILRVNLRPVFTFGDTVASEFPFVDGRRTSGLGLQNREPAECIGTKPEPNHRLLRL